MLLGRPANLMEASWLSEQEGILVKYSPGTGQCVQKVVLKTPLIMLKLID